MEQERPSCRLIPRSHLDDAAAALLDISEELPRDGASDSREDERVGPNDDRGCCNGWVATMNQVPGE